MTTSRMVLSEAIPIKSWPTMGIAGSTHPTELRQEGGRPQMGSEPPPAFGQAPERLA
ncbi:hypothetical protein ACQKIK_07565 [Pseudomonas sp. NPDC047961]